MDPVASGPFCPGTPRIPRNGRSRPNLPHLVLVLLQIRRLIFAAAHGHGILDVLLFQRQLQFVALRLELAPPDGHRSLGFIRHKYDILNVAGYRGFHHLLDFADLLSVRAIHSGIQVFAVFHFFKLSLSQGSIGILFRYTLLPAGQIRLFVDRRSLLRRAGSCTLSHRGIRRRGAGH